MQKCRAGVVGAVGEFSTGVGTGVEERNKSDMRTRSGKGGVAENEEENGGKERARVGEMPYAARGEEENCQIAGRGSCEGSWKEGKEGNEKDGERYGATWEGPERNENDRGGSEGCHQV